MDCGCRRCRRRFKAIHVKAPADKGFVSIDPQFNLDDPLGREWAEGAGYGDGGAAAGSERAVEGAAGAVSADRRGGASVKGGRAGRLTLQVQASYSGGRGAGRVLSSPMPREA